MFDFKKAKTFILNNMSELKLVMISDSDDTLWCIYQGDTRGICENLDNPSDNCMTRLRDASNFTMEVTYLDGREVSIPCGLTFRDLITCGRGRVMIDGHDMCDNVTISRDGGFLIGGAAFITEGDIENIRVEGNTWVTPDNYWTFEFFLDEPQTGELT